MSTPYGLVDIALQLSDFVELSGSTGDYTYFRHSDGRIVQINRTRPYNNNELKEIADQARIPPTVFMERILVIQRVMEDRKRKNSSDSNKK